MKRLNQLSPSITKTLFVFYLILVSFAFTLQAVSQPPNDQCSNAIEVFEGVTPFNNIDANSDGPDWSCIFLGLGGSDVWYIYEATCTGDVLFSLCNDGAQPPTDYDATMEIFDTGSCLNLEEAFRGCNDDGCVETVGPPVLTFSVELGNQYIIRLGGFIGDEGTGHLEIIPQENCISDSARPIPTLSEWSLIAVAVILGIAGLIAVRRRKLTA